MTTQAVMNTRIADEIKRTNLGSQIDLAIASAVDHYQQKLPFFFRDESAPLTFEKDVRYYDLPSDFGWPKGPEPMLITANDSTYPLLWVTWGDINRDDLESSGGETGIPAEWAYFEQMFRVYPVPMQDGYTGRFYYFKDNGIADTNWYAAAERVIRFRAKCDLYKNVIHQYDKAGVQRQQELEAASTLIGFTNKRRNTGRIRPWF